MEAKVDKYRALFMDYMYYSDQEIDKGYGIICWRIDHRGIVLQIPDCEDIMYPNGVHDQKILYRDYFIEDNIEGNIVFMRHIKIDNLYEGDIFTKVCSKNSRFIVYGNNSFYEIKTRQTRTFEYMCMHGWNPIVLGNKYQHPELLEYYPNGSFVYDYPKMGQPKT